MLSGTVTVPAAATGIMTSTVITTLMLVTLTHTFKLASCTFGATENSPPVILSVA